MCGPNTVPLACMPCGGCVPRRWWGAVPGGVACHRCEGRLVSGAVPPPAARSPERAAGVPRPVCPGCSRCGRGDPAPVPQRAPLRAGVARCRGGGRASPGGVPATVVRGAWCQELCLPRPPVLWSGQPGFRDPVSRVRSVWAWGPSGGPTACALVVKKVPTRTGPCCAPSAGNPCRFAPDQRLHLSESRVPNPKI